tara:strand:- start:12 stop:791 length:780 start_codon:yes stop_codon:yes gene_type:complete
MSSLVYGNGESRQIWDTTKSYMGFTTWGCNAAYRDCKVDNLVAIDYGIQQEIYESGYAVENECYFADWATLEEFDPEFLKTSYLPEDIYETKKYDTNSCVVQGKERETAEKNYQEIISQFPHLDKDDVKRKCYTNVGLYITWLKALDRVRYIDYPREWCAGATAMYLACKEKDCDVYMLGFDLSDIDEPINNIYKGTNNYLSEEARGFNTDDWTTQLIQVFKDFPDTQFYWVVPEDASPLVCENVRSITYKDLDKIVNA